MQHGAGFEVTHDRHKLTPLKRLLIHTQNHHGLGRPPRETAIDRALHDAVGLRPRQVELPGRRRASRFGHPINGEAFKTYVEKVLAPTLKPGDLVIMDNLGSHKGAAIRQAIRAARAKLFFLPKYSPDLNPIEQVFAKLKHLLRKAAARTIETLTAAVGELLGAYTAEECANYFTNAGYQA